MTGVGDDRVDFVLYEILQRFARISTELRADGVDVDALLEERADLIEQARERGFPLSDEQVQRVCERLMR